MRRDWLQDDDGTYYRNCPLIMNERERLISTLLPWRARRLAAEWQKAFLEGVTRSDAIGRRDRVVTPAPYREAYPDHPKLWVLDTRRSLARTAEGYGRTDQP